MKNILLFLLFVLFATVINSFAQTTIDSVRFYIKDTSGVLKANNTDNCYVVEFSGKSASELYTNVLSSIATLYKNPDKVLSKVDNVSITISGTALDVPVPKDASEIDSVFPQENNYYGFDYTFSLQFKDGKIRINAPVIDVESILWANIFNGGKYKLVAPQFAGIHFNNSSDKITISFQKYLNELIQTIIKKSETVNNW